MVQLQDKEMHGKTAVSLLMSPFNDLNQIVEGKAITGTIKMLCEASPGPFLLAILHYLSFF